MSRNKVKGFTLTEVLLVLVLSVLVTGIGYMGLDSIMKQFYVVKNRNEATVDTSASLARIKKDFYSAQRVRCRNNGVSLSIGNRKIDYLWEVPFVVRYDRQVDVYDTLLTELIEMKKYHNHIEQYVVNAPVDSVLFSIEYMNEMLDVALVKNKFVIDKLEQIGHSNH